MLPPQRFVASVPATVTYAAHSAEPESLVDSLRWVALGPESAAGVAELAIAQTPTGIRVYGRARGDRGQWTLHWSTLLHVKLPGVGWERISRSLQSDADCDALYLSPADHAACPEWRRSQESHLARIRHAFRPGYAIRAGKGQQLLLPPSTIRAIFRHSSQAGVEELDPKPAGPLSTWVAGSDQVYALEIPWTAWPLTSERELSSLYLQADYCPDQGPCVHSTSAPDIALELKLPHPIQLQASLCEREPDPYYAPDDVPFLRIADSLPDLERLLESTRLYHFVNPSGGYLDRPDPTRTSPEILTVKYRQDRLQKVAGNWAICLPTWRLWNGADVNIKGTELKYEQRQDIERQAAEQLTSGSPQTLWEGAKPQYVEADDDDEPFEEQMLDERRVLLVKPLRNYSSASGEGSNGACERSDFSIWIVDVSAPTLRRALSLEGYTIPECGLVVVSAELSADGRSVDSVKQEYDFDAPATSSGIFEIRERYCLDDVSDSYLRCHQERRPFEDD